MTRPRATRPRRLGFTLIEVIAAIAIIGMLAAMTAAVLVRGMEGYDATAQVAQLHVDLASAMDRVDRALRSIPAATSGANISTVTPTSIAWTGTSGACSLSLSGTTLNLAMDGAAAQPILTDVTAFAVQCYDESNAALATSLSGGAVVAVRRVQITITATRNGRSDSLRTKLFIRSTMEGASL
jgi:prepilin-type N-terminal cleavage/methylation domain-containing protein